MISVQSRVAAVALLFFLSLPALALPSSASDNDALFREANNAMASGDLDTAVELLGQVPSPDQGGSRSMFVKSRMLQAKLLFTQKKYEQARESALEVLEIYPDNIEAKNFIGSVERETKPGYVTFLLDSARFLPALAKGALMTIMLVVLTMLISPFGGLLVALGRISRIKVLSGFCWFFIWIFRGTPLLLQLFFIYYGLPTLGITFSPITAAILGLGLNYSA
ncbi:MAG: ABC transporter permease subunit, partial [Desulfovibrionales bacterium]